MEVIVPPAPAILAESTTGALDPVTLLALGVGLAMLIYLLVLKRSSRGAGRPKAPSRNVQPDDQAAQHHLEGLLDELERMASVMSARFDDQAKRLEALIHEADERTRALEASLAASRAGDLAGRILAGSPPGHDSGLAALARHREIYELADAGQSAPRIAQKLRRPEGEVELILALRGRGGIS